MKEVVKMTDNLQRLMATVARLIAISGGASPLCAVLYYYICVLDVVFYMISYRCSLIGVFQVCLI